MLDELYCASCRDVVLFEQPPCADGHEGDCPEWVCTVCGTAVLTVAPVPTGATPTQPALPGAPGRRVAAA